MAQADVTKVVIWEDSGALLMARVVDWDGQSAQQADVSSITFKVYDTSDGSEVGTGTLTVADVMFDALQTDARWTSIPGNDDSTGYNFRTLMAASNFPSPDVTYRVEFKFTPPTDPVYFVPFDVTTQSIRTS